MNKGNNKKKILVPHWPVKVKHDVYTETVRNDYENNEDDSNDYRDTSSSIDIYGLTTEEKYYDLAVPFPIIQEEIYYLVTVIYTTGDSFHRDSGKHEFIALYKTKEKADLCALEIETHAKNSKNPKLQSKKYNIHGLIILDELDIPRQISTSWNGYFESLDRVDVSALTYNPEDSYKNKNRHKY